MAQSVQLKHHSVLNGLIICLTTQTTTWEKAPFVYKQTYLACLGISRLLFNAVVYMA